MIKLHVGIVVHWPAVEAVVSAMLLQLGHLPFDADPADGRLPDLVVRDASREPSAAWRELPAVELSGRSVGVTIETAEKVRVGNPFCLQQLQKAIQLVFGEVE